jgi:DNA topoisomerase-2
MKSILNVIILDKLVMAQNSDIEKYDRKTPREHVLLRPDTYIGSVEEITEDMWIYSEGGMIKKSITYIPGLYKIYDEILMNARDASVNDTTCNTIKIHCNIEDGSICVYNNGDDGIPIEQHTIHNVLVPTMIFGELLTGSNYNDNEERITGGRNGLGATCANIFSKQFIVEIDDAKRSKRYKQIWNDNMNVVNDPIIKKLPAKTKSSVKITFYPDYERFGLEGMNEDFNKGYKYVFIFIDVFSRYVDAILLKDKGLMNV